MGIRAPRRSAGFVPVAALFPVEWLANGELKSIPQNGYMAVPCSVPYRYLILVNARSRQVTLDATLPVALAEGRRLGLGSMALHLPMDG